MVGARTLARGGYGGSVTLWSLASAKRSVGYGGRVTLAPCVTRSVTGKTQAAPIAYAHKVTQLLKKVRCARVIREVFLLCARA